MKTLLPLYLTTLVATFSPFTLAESADRNKPVNLEADRVSVDDRQHVHIFEGNVKLNQGTLSISTARLVVRQDADGFQKGEAHGGTDGLARFKQKREGKGEFIEGEAERIEHDSRSERTEFFGRAMVRSGKDEVRGPYISYDAKTESYVASGGPGGGPKGPVVVTIQPKEKVGVDSSTTKP